MKAQKHIAGSSRHVAATTLVALGTCIVLVVAFLVPNNDGLPFLITAGLAGIAAGSLLAWRLHASLLTVPAGLIASYVLFSFVFYIFIYEPR